MTSFCTQSFSIRKTRINKTRSPSCLCPKLYYTDDNTHTVIKVIENTRICPLYRSTQTVTCTFAPTQCFLPCLNQRISKQQEIMVILTSNLWTTFQEYRKETRWKFLLMISFNWMSWCFISPGFTVFFGMHIYAHVLCYIHLIPTSPVSFYIVSPLIL